MKFTGDKCICTDCNDIIQSKYSGEFVACSCGESFVDQTEYYTRMGGHCVNLQYLLNQDFEDLLAVDEAEQVKIEQSKMVSVFKALRLQKGISQEQANFALGDYSISEIESAETPINSEIVTRLCSLYKIKLLDFFAQCEEVVESQDDDIVIYLVTIYHEDDLNDSFVLGMFRDLEYAKESGARYCREDMEDEGLKSPRHYYVVSNWYLK